MDSQSDTQNSETDFLEAELSSLDLTPDEQTQIEAVPAPAPAPSFVSSRTVGTAPRNARRIQGGIAKMADDLGSRARDMKHAVMLLEQQRPQIDSAEAAQDRMQEEIDKALARMKDGSRALKSMIEAGKNGDMSVDFQAQFAKSGRIVEELETAVTAYASNLLWLRSVWDQHVQTVELVSRMKEDLRH